MGEITVNRLSAVLAGFIVFGLVGAPPTIAQVSAKSGPRGTATTVPEPPAQPSSTYIIVPGGEASIAVGRLSSAPPEQLKIPPEFIDQGDVLLHSDTGMRLPKVHEGCRLVALEPSSDHAGAPASFADGALAEYDCRPSQDLTYVQVRFAGKVSYLKDHGLAEALPELANSIVQVDANIPNDQCANIQLPPQSPFTGFSVAQCGARWSGPGDAQGHVFGTAAMAFGLGTSVVVFSNTCMDEQCTANRPAFGRFILSFDISGLKESTAAGRQRAR